MFATNSDYEILTPDGWRDFRGLTITSGKETFTLTLETGEVVVSTENHCFFINGQKKQLKNIVIGDQLDTVEGRSSVVSIVANKIEDVFDIVEVDQDDHQFIVNNSIITKNCDEMAFVRPSIAREFWVSISPTLTTGGKALITSTPNSDEDQFATIWKQANKCTDEWGNTTELGINGFRSFQSYWWEHPDRDEAWKQAEMGRIGEERFRREMNCEFLVADETLVNSLKLKELQGIDPIFRQGQVRWFSKPQKDQMYLVALDPSLGTGGDQAAIQVFEAPSMRQVAEWQHNRTPIQKQIQVLKEITRYITDIVGNNNVYYSVENNTLGEAALVCISEIGEENIPGIFLSEPVRAGQSRSHRKGFTTTAKSKLVACAKLKSLVESDKIILLSKNLVSELKSFISSGSSFAAKIGDTDDLVMALVLIVRMVQYLKQYHPELESQVADRSEDFLEPMPFIAVF